MSVKSCHVSPVLAATLFTVLEPKSSRPKVKMKCNMECEDWSKIGMFYLYLNSFFWFKAYPDRQGCNHIGICNDEYVSEFAQLCF